jgi:capsular exopolysaccharide synthesis family protein
VNQAVDFQRFLGAIRKSWWIFFLLFFLGGAAGYGYSSRQTPLYASHITFYVGTPTISSNNANSTNQFAQDRAASYATLLSSDRLAALVINASGLRMQPHQLATKIKATAQLNTVIVAATVTDPSPARARRIAGYVGQVFPTLVSQLDDTTRNAATVKLSVISGPTSSSAPVSPRTHLNTLLGAGVGIVLALAVAILRELLDVSLRSADGLRDFTGLPVLATVPLDRKAKAAPLLVGELAKSPRAEALRQLRTNLRFLDATKPVRVLLVTSSVEAEGKSTTAANLGLLMAEDGRSVLLIEGDVRKPTISQLFGVESAVGLTDVLAGLASLTDVLQPWGESKLTVLPAGAPAPNPSELLGSDRATALIDTVRERYDVVIVDSPPLLPVADASVLASRMDGVLVVFRNGKTRRTHLHSALSNLESVHARVIGTVLNMRPSRRFERRAYGHYYADIPEAPTPEPVEALNAAAAKSPGEPPSDPPANGASGSAATELPANGAKRPAGAAHAAGNRADAVSGTGSAASSRRQRAEPGLRRAGRRGTGRGTRRG